MRSSVACCRKSIRQSKIWKMSRSSGHHATDEPPTNLGSRDVSVLYSRHQHPEPHSQLPCYTRLNLVPAYELIPPSNLHNELPFNRRAPAPPVLLHPDTSHIVYTVLKTNHTIMDRSALHIQHADPSSAATTQRRRLRYRTTTIPRVPRPSNRLSLLRVAHYPPATTFRSSPAKHHLKR